MRKLNGYGRIKNPDKLKGKALRKALKKGKLISTERETKTSETYTGIIQGTSYYLYEHHLHSRQGEDRIPYMEWKSLIREIFKEVGKAITANDAGIYVENFGYFGVVKFPNKNRKKNVFSSTRRLSFHLRYNITFFPIVKGRDYRKWSMDGGFNQAIVEALDKEVSRGKDYRLNYNLYSNFYGFKNKR